MRALLCLLRTYAVALIVTVAALLFTLVLWPLSQRFPFALFIAAVMAAVWRGGPRAGLVTTALSVPALALVWFLHADAGAGVDQDYLPRLGLFVFVGLLASYLSQQCRRAIQASDHVHATLTSLGEALLFTDTAGTITFLNPRAEGFTGWKQAAATGLPLRQVLPLLHEETRQPLADLVAAVTGDRTGTPLPFRGLLQPVGGLATPVEGTAAPVRTAHGQVTGVTFLFRAITERHKTEQVSRQREEQLAAMAACVPVGLLLLDPLGRCTYTNRTWQEVTGRSLDDSLGDGWARSIHARDRARLVEAWTAAVQAGQAFTDTFWCQSLRGEVRWVRLRSAPLHAADGKLLGHVAVLEDAAGQRQAEETLRESERRFTALLDSLPGLAFVKDAEGRYLYVNGVQAQLFQDPGGGWRGKTADEVWPACSDSWRQGERKVLETQKACRSIEAVRHGDEVRNYLVRHFPIETGPDSSALLGGIAIDVSEQLRAEEALRKTQEDCERRLREQSAEQEQAGAALRQAQQEFQRQLEQQAAGQQRVEEALRKAQDDFRRQLEERTAAQRQAEETLRRTREELQRQVDQERGAHRQAAAAWQQARDEYERRLSPGAKDPRQLEEALAQARDELQRRLEQQAADQQKVEAALWKECEDLQRQLEERGAALQRAEEALRQTQSELQKQSTQQVSVEERLREAQAEFQKELQERDAEIQRQEEALHQTGAELAAHQEQHTVELQQAQAYWQEQLDQSRRNKEFWEGLIQGSADGVFAFDQAFRYTVWNPAMERLSNLERGRMLGRSAFEVFPALKENGEGRCFEETLRGQSGRIRLASLDGGNGQDRWLEGYYAPVRGASAEVVGGIAVVREMRRTPEPQSGRPLEAREPIVINGQGVAAPNAPPSDTPPSDWLSFN